MPAVRLVFQVYQQRLDAGTELGACPSSAKNAGHVATCDLRAAKSGKSPHKLAAPGAADDAGPSPEVLVSVLLLSAAGADRLDGEFDVDLAGLLEGERGFHALVLGERPAQVHHHGCEIRRA